MVKRVTKIKGFTLIEILLFIALSSALAVGIIASSNGPVARQRYSAAVAEIEDYLQGIYSSLINVQSSGAGNSEKMIYGKLVTFGENFPNSTIHVYDIYGNVDTTNITISSTNLEILKNATIFKPDTDTAEFYKDSSFTPSSDASIENIDSSKNILSGALIIFRSPLTGNINTYVSTSGFISDPDVDTIWDRQQSPSAAADAGGDPRYLSTYLSTLIFGIFGGPNTIRSVDICINSPDIGFAGNIRRAIRIDKAASGSMGVFSILANENDPESMPCDR